MRFALGSRLVGELKVKRRLAGVASSFNLSERVSISVSVAIVVLVVLDIVVLVAPVVGVVVDVVVVVAPEPHTGGTLMGLTGSVPASSSLRSGQPSWSRSTPTRTPSPGATHV